MDRSTEEYYKWLIMFSRHVQAMRESCTPSFFNTKKNSWRTTKDRWPAFCKKVDDILIKRWLDHDREVQEQLADVLTILMAYLSYRVKVILDHLLIGRCAYSRWATKQVQRPAFKPTREQWGFQSPRKRKWQGETIRIVDDREQKPVISPVKPLTIRKKSGFSTPSTETLQERASKEHLPQFGGPT
ncbi:MAG: hypothetical protein Q9168_005351 [Polycauliona sp. 1 TL-2023]